MDKRVEEFLENNPQNDKRAQVLIDAGLYNKVYMPEAEYDSYNLSEDSEYDYPEMEIDPKSGKTLYYRKEPIAVTDLEYQAILRHNQNEKQNGLSVLLKTVAVLIFIAGFIFGIKLGDDISYHFSWTYCLLIWLITAIIGVSIIWFSEVLRLLQEIKNRL